MPLTDNESKLTEITQALKPLEELWRIAKTWVEQIHMWQESPLSDVDADGFLSKDEFVLAMHLTNARVKGGLPLPDVLPDELRPPYP